MVVRNGGTVEKELSTKCSVLIAKVLIVSNFILLFFLVSVPES
jgi:hypothetical protein